MRKVLSLTIIFLALSVAVFAQGKDDARCPSISIEGPVGLTRPGNPIPFEAKVGDEAKKYNPTFHWSTSTGKIVEGQGTRSIKVVQSKEEPRDITVSLEVSDLPPDCPNSASYEGNGGDAPPPGEMLADFSPSERDLGSEQIDRIASEMKGAPNSQLFVLAIVAKGTPQDNVHAVINRLRAKLLDKHQINPISITFLTGFGDEDRIKLFLVPPGADPPECEECKEFKDFDQVSCPTITVAGPAGIIQPGEPEVFTAIISDEAKAYQPKYQWSVEGGKIFEGQGTLSIKSLRRERIDNLTATIEVLGLPKGCANVVSETVPLIIEARALFIDEYGSIPVAEEYAKLRAANVELKRHKYSSLYLIKYPPTSIVSFEKRNLRLKDFAANVLHMKGDFKMVLGPEMGEERTKIFIVPPGADAPQP